VAVSLVESGRRTDGRKHQLQTCNLQGEDRVEKGRKEKKTEFEKAKGETLRRPFGKRGVEKAPLNIRARALN
jgi:hypothetical protein